MEERLFEGVRALQEDLDLLRALQQVEDSDAERRVGVDQQDDLGIDLDLGEEPQHLLVVDFADDQQLLGHWLRIEEPVLEGSGRCFDEPQLGAQPLGVKQFPEELSVRWRVVQQSQLSGCAQRVEQLVLQLDRLVLQDVILDSCVLALEDP